jgi:hypothetical protein
MSRPQIHMNSPAMPAPGQIVNGGLIDFQDNFHRGMAEYAQLISAQQAAGYPPHPAMQAVHPYSAMQQSLPQTTLLGHPSFINVAGKMYRPVEEPPSTVMMVAPVESQKRPAEPEPRMLTEDDIDQRVAQRVDEWAAAQRKPVPASFGRAGKPRAVVSDVERAASRVKSVNAGMYQPSRLYSPV